MNHIGGLSAIVEVGEAKIERYEACGAFDNFTKRVVWVHDIEDSEADSSSSVSVLDTPASTIRQSCEQAPWLCIAYLHHSHTPAGKVLASVTHTVSYSALTS
jgi:hypothetical protein